MLRLLMKSQSWKVSHKIHSDMNGVWVPQRMDEQVSNIMSYEDMTSM